MLFVTWMKQVLSVLVLRLKEGDILVGKVTPKGEKDLSAEERLLPRYLWG